LAPTMSKGGVPAEIGLTGCSEDELLTMRRATEVPKERLQNIILLTLVVLLEVAWGASLVYLVFHFL
jgi:hypothetical protein